MGPVRQPLVHILYTNTKLQERIDFNKAINPVASSVLFLKLKLINTPTQWRERPCNLCKTPLYVMKAHMKKLF